MEIHTLDMISDFKSDVLIRAQVGGVSITFMTKMSFRVIVTVAIM